LCCSVVQCVAVCCSVLQCVAVCCSVLQCVAVWCIVLQCLAVWCSVLQCGAVCCSVLQCAAVCCSVLQCVAVCCSVPQCVGASWWVTHMRAWFTLWHIHNVWASHSCHELTHRSLSRTDVCATHMMCVRHTVFTNCTHSCVTCAPQRFSFCHIGASKISRTDTYITVTYWCVPHNTFHSMITVTNCIDHEHMMCAPQHFSFCHFCASKMSRHFQNVELQLVVLHFLHFENGSSKWQFKMHFENGVTFCWHFAKCHQLQLYAHKCIYIFDRASQFVTVIIDDHTAGLWSLSRTVIYDHCHELFSFCHIGASKMSRSDT